MPSAAKEFKQIEKVMLARLDWMAQLHGPESERTKASKAYHAYPEEIRRVADRVAVSAGFLEDGNKNITWKGLEYRYQKHHPARFWWAANWFPTIVALGTIVTGATVAAASVLLFLLPPNCPS